MTTQFQKKLKDLADGKAERDWQYRLSQINRSNAERMAEKLVATCKKAAEQAAMDGQYETSVEFSFTDEEVGFFFDGLGFTETQVEQILWKFYGFLEESLNQEFYGVFATDGWGIGDIHISGNRLKSTIELSWAD